MTIGLQKSEWSGAHESVAQVDKLDALACRYTLESTSDISHEYICRSGSVCCKHRWRHEWGLDSITWDATSCSQFELVFARTPSFAAESFQCDDGGGGAEESEEDVE